MIQDRRTVHGFDLLFKPGKIGSLTIKNRLVFSPMLTNFSTVNGRITDRLADYFEERARGGVGAIFTGSIVVKPNGRVTPHQALISDDSCIPDLKKAFDRIRKHDVAVILQLAHHGRNAPPDVNGGECVGPSPIPTISYGFVPRELSIKEIKGLIVDFSAGAERAIKAGAHGVDVNAAHGHLIGQFLSPYSNKRNDEYGGDLEGRLNFLLQIIRSVREKIGEQPIITCRISADEYIEGGITIEDSKITTKRIEEAGVDAVYVSAGVHDSKIEMIEPTGAQPRGYLIHLAEEIAEVARKPVIAGGRVNHPVVAEEILRKGKIDFISLGRPLIADPEYPKKAQENRPQDIRICLSDNRGCIEKIKPKYVKGDFVYHGITCSVNPAVGREAEFSIRSTEIPKNILIVGGGPAGLQAAIILSLRGHRVRLYESRDGLGGNLAFVSMTPNKEEFRSYLQYLLEQISKSDIETFLNTTVDLDLIEGVRPKPDVIILATGGRHSNIQDAPANKVWEIERVFSNGDDKTSEQRILILGGEMIGAETAQYLTARGKEVTIIEKSQEIGYHMTNTVKTEFLSRINDYPIHILTSANIVKFEGNKAHVSVKGETKKIDFDVIVNASDRLPNDLLYEQIKNSRLHETYRVGDCLSPQTLLEALHTSTELAYKL